jgi:hypothetical protein
MDFLAFASRVGLDLERFQRRIAKAAARPEREFVALLPRGQGKTTLLAAIALHDLVTVERAAVYCAASSREQARIFFEAAAHFSHSASTHGPGLSPFGHGLDTSPCESRERKSPA